MCVNGRSQIYAARFAPLRSRRVVVFSQKGALRVLLYEANSDSQNNIIKARRREATGNFGVESRSIEVTHSQHTLTAHTVSMPKTLSFSPLRRGFSVTSSIDWLFAVHSLGSSAYITHTAVDHFRRRSSYKRSTWLVTMQHRVVSVIDPFREQPSSWMLPQRGEPKHSRDTQTYRIGYRGRLREIRAHG